MYSMPSPPAEDEPSADRLHSEDQKPLLIWLARLWAAAWCIGILVTLWESPKVQLRTLYAITRTLNVIATAIGTTALMTEAKYYETVNSLH